MRNEQNQQQLNLKHRFISTDEIGIHLFAEFAVNLNSGFPYTKLKFINILPPRKHTSAKQRSQT
jgi:hypothetical protein